MNIYINSSEDVIEILGGYQKRTNKKKVRFSTLCVIVDNGEGKVIYNELTKSLVFLTDHDFNVVTKKENESSTGFQYLFKNYFLVPENFNDIEAAEKVKKHFLDMMTDDIRTSNIRTFTILPTTDCNARCFYCYEKGIRHLDMTEETALKIADFIIKRRRPNNITYLRWFGGEPLFNMKVIDLICSELKKAGVQFQSHIVTNGYLLEPEVTKRAGADWGLDNVQITLDGTEEVYNKAKHYIYKDGESPFKHVLNNCEAALKNGIKISFRLNVDEYNANDIMNLLDLIYERFGNRIGVSIFPLFESAMTKKKTDEDRDRLYEKLYEIEDKAIRLGLYRHSVHDKYRRAMCIVDDGCSIMFQPDGSMGVCEHHADDNKMSHIDNPVFKQEDIDEWMEKCKPEPGLCDDCPLVPWCIRVKKCPEESVCNKHIKARKIRGEKAGVMNLYRAQINRPQQQQQPMRINITPIEITQNGVYTATQNVNGYNPVIVNVKDTTPYTPIFAAVRESDGLYIIYLEQNLDYFPEFTKEEFVNFINKNTNLSDNIGIEEIGCTKSINTWFRIDLKQHPKLRTINTFEWNGGEICNGNIHLAQGKTNIIKW